MKISLLDRRKLMNLKTWFQETRPNFLLITPLSYSVGIASAFIERNFNPLGAFIGLIGVLLAHVSINVINDYFDYKSGLDFTTKRTPFSGGSGIITSGRLAAKDVYRFALACIAICGVIGFYFTLTVGWMLLPLIMTAALSIYFYTTHFAHWYIGEIVTGLNFGPLMVLGAYFIMTGKYGVKPLAAGMIPGILIGTLLFLNEFPDLEADKKIGRRNIVIKLGLKDASKIYAALITSVYAWVAVCLIARLMPITMLIAFLSMPLAIKTIKGVTGNYGNMELLIPALGLNVMLVLLTMGLTFIGLLISILV
jgi:1,4-dihydroxy-2-naphthoate octaprenyltransferase